MRSSWVSDVAPKPRTRALRRQSPREPGHTEERGLCEDGGRVCSWEPQGKSPWGYQGLEEDKRSRPQSLRGTTALLTPESRTPSSDGHTLTLEVVWEFATATAGNWSRWEPTRTLKRIILKGHD